MCCLCASGHLVAFRPVRSKAHVLSNKQPPQRVHSTAFIMCLHGKTLVHKHITAFPNTSSVHEITTTHACKPANRKVARKTLRTKIVEFRTWELPPSWTRDSFLFLYNFVVNISKFWDILLNPLPHSSDTGSGSKQILFYSSLSLSHLLLLLTAFSL